MGDNNLHEGLRWLAQAEADLKTAQDCLKDGNFYASAFFSQQAAEKALEGFLYSKGLRAILTHSVLTLLRESAGYRGELEGLEPQARELDRHYVGSRYPNFYPDSAPYQYYTEEEAQRCIHCAISILKEVGRYLRG